MLLQEKYKREKLSVIILETGLNKYLKIQHIKFVQIPFASNFLK